MSIIVKPTKIIIRGLTTRNLVTEVSRLEQNFIVGQNMGGQKIVYVQNDGRIALARNNIFSHRHRVMGITKGAGTVGNTVGVVLYGEYSDVSFSFTASKPLFLGLSGLLTETPPTKPSAAFSRMVGYAETSNKIFIRIGQYYIL